MNCSLQVSYRQLRISTGEDGIIHKEKGVIPGEERRYFSSEADEKQEKVKFEGKGIGIQGIYTSNLLSLNQDIRTPNKNEGARDGAVSLRRKGSS